MFSLEQVLEKLKDRKLTVVSEVSGVSIDTLYKLTGGRSIEVSYTTVKKLSDYLEANP